MTLHYRDESVELHHGDCLDVLKTLADNSVDSVVTDPPYNLGFMGQAWDRPASAARGYKTEEHLAATPYGRARAEYGGASYGNGQLESMREFQSWCQLWATECLRVLKPGGHMLAFGGTRTFHRLACAVEDVGFEIRDSICWLTGSGFPKSLDVGRAIDKHLGATREATGTQVTNVGMQGNRFGAGGATGEITRYDVPVTAEAKQWQGYGTALKPSFEPIVVARKPIQGTVAANVLEHGTGALNIDGCRVGTDQMVESRMTQSARGVLNANGRDVEHGTWQQKPNDNPAVHTGRWPTNTLLDECAADELDQQSGMLKPGGDIAPGSKGAGKRKNAVYGVDNNDRGDWQGYGDSGGASRYFPVFKYTAKAGTTERPTVKGVSGELIAHPT